MEIADPAVAALNAAMDAIKITDDAERAGIAAICMGESGLSGVPEVGYAHTSNDRIREIYPTRTAGLSDDELDAIKADDRKWFDLMYGNELGNRPDTNDGYDYRGRGGLQITGRDNYIRCANACGHPEVVDNPNLVSSDISISAAMSVAYIALNYRGGGFEEMMRCVGSNIPDIAATKEAAYQRFLASGEFNYNGSTPLGLKPLGMMNVAEIETFQAAHGCAVDGVVGPQTIAAWQTASAQGNMP